MKHRMEILKTQSKLVLPNDPAVPLLSVHLKEMKSASQRDIYKSTSIMVFFTIAKIPSSPGGPSAPEWIQTTCFLYILDIQQRVSSILSFAAQWVELEDTILREISHTPNDKKHTISSLWKLEKDVQVAGDC